MDDESYPSARHAEPRGQYQQDAAIVGATLRAVFNYTYRRSGTLWKGRYRATVMDSKQYLL
ncbi:MAG: hypothetical protein Q7J21_07975, partial [Rugosibacter sp.]|nr:hypothetical protein [Rugosibacter sp.]